MQWEVAQVDPSRSTKVVKFFIIRGELIGGEGAVNPGRATVELQVTVMVQASGWDEEKWI